MLSDFFRINMPYGIMTFDGKKWMAFNREYMPLGFNDTSFGHMRPNDYTKLNLPVSTHYSGIKTEKIEKVASYIRYYEKDHLIMVWLYNDNTNPMNDTGKWNEYFNKIKILSSIKVKNKAPYKESESSLFKNLIDLADKLSKVK